MIKLTLGEIVKVPKVIQSLRRWMILSSYMKQSQSSFDHIRNLYNLIRVFLSAPKSVWTKALRR